MQNPVLVEVVRGDLIESRHTGAVAVVTPEGEPVFSIGDVQRAVFPRSAVKALQALPLVESGAADAISLSEEALALACSSHNAEPNHVAVAQDMLDRAGQPVSALECGTHWPFIREKTLIDFARSGHEPTPLHNNCSGKHAGFLCLASHLGVPASGYVEPDHPVQEMVTSALSDMTGESLGAAAPGIDGCSVPTYALPLSSLARGFARFASGAGLSENRRNAADRLFRACAAHPFMVAGTGRFDTDVTAFFGDRLLVKVGAEGVYAGAIPELGLGVAIKCDDGATRASEVMMAAVLNTLMLMVGDKEILFRRFMKPDIVNWAGKVTGEIRPAEGFRQALASIT